MVPIIIGYTVEAWKPETIHDHVQTPQVPKNYKDETKIQEWEEKNLAPFRAKWEKMAPWLKATGKIASIYAIDLVEQQMFDSRVILAEGAERLSPGTRFSRWLLDVGERAGTSERMNWFDGHPFGGGFYQAPPVCFYGFRPKPFLRLVGLNCIRDGKEIPLRFWYQNEWCLDPKEMLLETEVKDKISLAKLLAEAPGGPIEVPDLYQEPHQNARADALLALELGVRYQLIPDWEDTKLRKLVDDGIIPQLVEAEEEEAADEEAAAEEQPAEEPEKPRRRRRRTTEPT